MPLSEPQCKHLRRLGHDLRPIVLVGQKGVGTSLIAELERALHDHELVKIKVRVGDRDARNAALELLVTETRSELVQRIGNVGLLYRRNPERPGLLLPD